MTVVHWKRIKARLKDCLLITAGVQNIFSTYLRVYYQTCEVDFYII